MTVETPRSFFDKTMDSFGAEVTRDKSGEIGYEKAKRNLAILEDENQDLDIKLAYTMVNKWEPTADAKEISACLKKEIAYLRSYIEQCERALKTAA